MIRNGFIYKPAKVALVGESVVLADQSSAGEAFADAREPVAQAFKQVGHRRRRRVRGDRQPLQVQGLRHAGPRRPGQRQRPPRPPGQRAGDLRRPVQDPARHHPGLPRGRLQRLLRGGPDPGPQGGRLHQPGVDQRPRRGELQLRRHDRLARPRARQRGGRWPTSTRSTSGTSTATSRSTTSTAASTTNVTNLYAPNPFRSSDHNPEIVGINTVEARRPAVDAASPRARCEYGADERRCR